MSLASTLARPSATRVPASSTLSRQTGVMARGVAGGVAGGVAEERNETIKWLWEADASEVMLAVGHAHGCRRVLPCYTLNTLAPLRPEQVEEALRHLQSASPRA
nr:uncharacterized protein LOC113805859 [Penaeus vannamei]